MRWRRLALLAALPVTLVAACATSVKDDGRGSGGAGGEDDWTPSAGNGGPKPDAGLDAPWNPDVSIPCGDVSDCAALNDTCGVAACTDGFCTKTPMNEFGACDDGLFCTEDDTCVNGACTGGTARFCPSQDSCHLGTCDEELDTCKNIAGNDGAQCDDGDLCTQAGKCSGGACMKGSPLSCAIYNTGCSVGVCDPAVGCKAQPTNENNSCDNGQWNGCSYGKCQAGSCVSLPQNEGQLCETGIKDPCSYGLCENGGCVSIPQNDGEPCDGFFFDPCVQGECQAGTCVAKPVADGGACNDNLFCTINDTCSAGLCSGEPNPCASPDNPCMVGVCNEFNWSCSVVPGNNGGACDDQNACTSGEACLNGTCVGGQPSNEGAACDDSDGCTAGTSCVNGACTNPASQINQCSMGDSCCPAGCSLADDSDCLYWAPGVQQNVSSSQLHGWSLCFSGKYDQNQPSLQSILAQCDKSKLLLACRPVGNQSFTLLAMANRVDVLFDCGQQDNCTKQSNGVGWYYSNNYSWGFAPGNQPVNRSACDYDDGVQLFPELRMCWHTNSGNVGAGFRCGANDLNNSFTWERVIYEAD